MTTTTTIDISTCHGAGVRASDAEREGVARILRAATGQGLLTLAEVDEQLAAVYAARYRHELEPLTTDLPDGGRQLPASTPQARTVARTRLVRHAAVVALVAVLLVAAWLNSDAEFFWPVWPIGFLVFGLVRHARGVGPLLRTQPVS